MGQRDPKGEAVNTCGTCKYFGKSLDREFWQEAGGTVVVTRLHVCDLIKHLNEGNSDEEEALLKIEPAGVIDGSGYHAALCVSEEFGCNQWASKS